jgi:hypothetical protein
MALDQITLRNIEKLLVEECGAIDDYLALLSSEQDHVVKLQSDKVAECAERRAIVADRISVVRTSRDDLVRILNKNSKTTLTELVTTGGSAAEKRRILPVIGKLKQKAKVMDQRSKELNQVVNFSLGLVNGSLSIIWSATQTVTRCYNAFGGMTELFQPNAPRAGSLLGQA